MGIDRRSVAFLVASRRLGVTFESTLQLGRQTLPKGVALPAAFAEAGCHLSEQEASSIARESGGYADELLRYLGGQTVESIDASDWEGATFVHDLNETLPNNMRQRYSVVLDGGTLEHIFDIPTALRSSLDAVRVGGHFVAIAPTNGWCGHGFYQLSPELFYAMMGPATGFRVRCALVRTLRLGARFYRVPDPAEVHGRVTLRGVWPSLLYFVAQRVDDQDLDAARPQQTDYIASWSGNPSGTGRRQRVKAMTPFALQDPLSEMYSMIRTLRRFPLVARDFQPVRLRELANPSCG